MILEIAQFHISMQQLFKKHFSKDLWHCNFNNHSVLEDL